MVDAPRMGGEVFRLVSGRKPGEQLPGKTAPLRKPRTEFFTAEHGVPVSGKIVPAFRRTFRAESSVVRHQRIELESLERGDKPPAGRGGR